MNKIGSPLGNELATLLLRERALIRSLERIIFASDDSFYSLIPQRVL
jgi:hypothetical protein